MRTVVAALLAAGVVILAGPAAAASPAVTNAWSRPAVGTGVVYATLVNASSQSDRLVGARSPIATHVELHQSVSSMGPMGSMASMHPVAFIALPPHSRVALKPGGYHLMLIGLEHDLKAGTTFPLAVHFARAGWTTIQVRVHAMDF